MKQGRVVLIMLGMMVCGDFATADGEKAAEVNGIIEEISENEVVIHEQDQGKILRFEISQSAFLPKELKKGDSVKINYTLTVKKIEVQLPGTVAPGRIKETPAPPLNNSDGVLDDRAFYRA